MSEFRTNLSSDSLPDITVVMPIRNEENFIERSLGAVLTQNYPHHKLDVLIADGMSTDRTRDLISQLTASHGIRVNILDNPGRIVPTGMNIAIRQAKGEIIIRVDGHAIIPIDYVNQCVKNLLLSGVDCVGGAVESVGNGYTGEAIAIAMSSSFGVGGSSFRTSANEAKPILTDTVPFGAFQYGVFKRIGLFNEQMVRHQDYEFNYRLRAQGGQILLLPEVRVKYEVRSELKSLWRQFWQYGVWKGRFIRMFPDSMKIRHIIPPLFIFLLFFGFILSLFAKSFYLIFGFILGAYIFFLLTASCLICAKGKAKFAPLFPVILTCIHFSWGIGVWIGLLSSKRYISQLKSGANVKL